MKWCQFSRWQNSIVFRFKYFSPLFWRKAFKLIFYIPILASSLQQTLWSEYENYHRHKLKIQWCGPSTSRAQQRPWNTFSKPACLVVNLPLEWWCDVAQQTIITGTRTDYLYRRRHELKRTYSFDKCILESQRIFLRSAQNSRAIYRYNRYANVLPAFFVTGSLALLQRISAGHPVPLFLSTSHLTSTGYWLLLSFSISFNTLIILKNLLLLQLLPVWKPEHFLLFSVTYCIILNF